MMLSDSIAQCKSRLPMPKLFSVLGLPEARRSMRSPFREDGEPSFSVFQVGDLWFYKDHATGESGDEISLMQRHTGCAKDDAIKSYHELAGVALPVKPKKQSGSLGKLVAIYDYLNEQGQLVHQTLRYEPKRFLQRRPATPGMRAANKIAKCDRDGNWWLWTLRGIEPVLYHLPQIISAAPEKPIYLCEGEKDADALAAAWNVVTTTAPMGAGKWRPSYTETLRNRDVIIWPDTNHLFCVTASKSFASPRKPSDKIAGGFVIRE
jgi:DNA primase